MTNLHELLKEAADWIAASRDEVILAESVGGDTATLPDEARQIVDDANDLIGRLQAAAHMLEHRLAKADLKWEAHPMQDWMDSVQQPAAPWRSSTPRKPPHPGRAKR